eukprot:3402136-Rhodomonas_salina.1
MLYDPTTLPYAPTAMPYAPSICSCDYAPTLCSYPIFLQAVLGYPHTAAGCYAMSGTDTAYGPTRSTQEMRYVSATQYCDCIGCYGICGTELAYGAMAYA